MVETGDKRVRCEIADHVAVITLARPEKLNALDMEMVFAIERACQAIEDALMLGNCCLFHRDPASALRQYEARRIPRTTAI